MCIYKHIKCSKPFCTETIYILKSTRTIYYSWTKYDNKRGSVIFSKRKLNAIEITYYLQITQNWHPESCHKWLVSTHHLQATPTQVTAHALPKKVSWKFGLFPFLSHTRHESAKKRHSQVQRTCDRNRCPDSMPPPPPPPPAPTIMHHGACSVRTKYGEYIYSYTYTYKHYNTKLYDK